MSSVLRFPAIVGKTGHGGPPLSLSAGFSGPSDLTARRPSAVGRPTGTADPLLIEAIATAFESLRELDARARAVARAFRRRDLDDGHDGLVELVHATQIFVELTTAASRELGGAGVDTDEDTEPAGDAMRRAINEVIAAQQSGDSAAMARALDPRFVAALADWRLVLERLDGAVGGSGPFGHAA